MIENLSNVFDRVLRSGLKLTVKKCSLFRKSVEYLGHIISSEGVTTDPRKIEDIRYMSTPVNVGDLRSFIEICSYYRKFVKDLTKVAKPLHRFTENNSHDECQAAFEKLKHSLKNAPILAHPDFRKDLILDTDASNFAMGAVLSQMNKGQERVVAYASKALSKSERRYCVTRKECWQ